MFLNTHFPGAKKYWHMGTFYDWSEAPSPSHEPCPSLWHLHVRGHPRLRHGPGPAVFRLSEHIDRFLHSASVIKMKSSLLEG